MSTNNLIKNITSKDSTLSLDTIKNIIKTSNTKDFKKLCQNADYIFPFLKKRISDDFVKLINKEDLNTIFEFSKIYCEDFENIIVQSWLKFASQDLTDEILEIFENGTDEQKTYCAIYFKHIQDPLAIEFLKKEAYSKNTDLRINCAKTLATFKNTETLNEMYEIVSKGEDEFEKLQAYEFIISYNTKESLNFVISNCFSSPFILNIICLILNNNDFYSLKNLFSEHKIAQIFHVLIENYPENLTLDTISYYQIYDFIKYLTTIENDYIKNLLYIAKEQFSDYINNDIYLFDLDKNTKNDLRNILNLLNNTNIDNKAIKNELTQNFENETKINLALEIIKNNKIKKHAKTIIELINSQNITQNTLIKALATLKDLDEISNIDKSILHKIKDIHAKAFCESLF